MTTTWTWGSDAEGEGKSRITGVPASISANGTSDDIDIDGVGVLMVSARIGAPTGTNPTISFYLDVKDAVGNWLQVLALTQLTAASYTYAGVGPGTATPYPLTAVARIRWVIGGTASPTFPAVALALAGR